MKDRVIDIQRCGKDDCLKSKCLECKRLYNSLYHKSIRFPKRPVFRTGCEEHPLKRQERTCKACKKVQNDSFKVVYKERREKKKLEKERDKELERRYLASIKLKD
jgi:hypothetical protein